MWRKGIVIGVILLLVLFLIACALVIRLHGSKKYEHTKTNENKREYVTEKQPQETKSTHTYSMSDYTSYEVVMNSTWNFKDGKSESENAYVENSIDNMTPIYFEIIRSDTEETIYKSPVIPINSHLSHIKLDKVLPAGIYPCTIVYHLVDDEQNTLSTVEVVLTINIRE